MKRDPFWLPLDEFKANIGAQKIFAALADQSARSTCDEPPGHHGDHLTERLARGLARAFQSPTAAPAPIKP